MTSKGKKTYYSFDVVDPATGQIKDSKNTSSPKKAKALLAKYKKQYGNPTVNGKAGGDPFKDGTFGKQSDFQFGGFHGPDDYQKMSGPITEKSFAPIGGPPTSRRKKRSVTAGKSNLTKDKQYVEHIRSSRLVEWKTKTGTHWHAQKGPPPVPGLSQKEKNEALALGAIRLQAVVSRPKTAAEVVVGRGVDNNAFIIIGHDRVEKEHTGYGGQSHTQCDAIDIVVGMGGPEPKEFEYKADGTTPNIDPNTGTEVLADTHPSFYDDAARIYISQKTNVDKNFGIGEWAKGKKTQAEVDNPEVIGKYGAKSAIAVKADNVRLSARESLRLVTGTDQKNSQGGDISGKSGIELIAMNNVETLQPMVLGDNLQLALTTIVDNLEALAKVFEAYTKYQMKFNAAVQKHTHITPFFALPALPSKEAIISGIKCDIETFSNTSLSVVKHITNLQGVKHNFLTPSGDGFINSRLNKVN